MPRPVSKVNTTTQVENTSDKMTIFIANDERLQSIFITVL